MYFVVAGKEEGTGDVQAPQSRNTEEKMKLVKEKYKKQYEECKAEKEALEIKLQDLLQSIGNATPVPESDGLILRPKCKDLDDHAQACPNDGDEHKLECKQCKRLFHYSCAGLPVFQLSHFITSRYRKFICKHCTIIPDHVKEIMAGYLASNTQNPGPEQPATALVSTAVQTLCDDTSELENDRDELVKFLHTTKQRLSKAELYCKEYHEHMKNMETELSVLRNSDSALRSLLDERETELDELQEKVHQKDTGLQREKDEKIQHQTEGRKLRERIKILQEEASKHKTKLKLQGGIIQKLRSKEDGCDGIQNEEQIERYPTPSADAIDSKLEAFSAGILTKVTELIENKFEILNGTQCSRTPTNQDAFEQNRRVGSRVASQYTDKKAFMRDVKNNEKSEESDKLKREKNIIIHGAEEVGKSREEIRKEDEGYIKAIFTKIGVDAAPVTVLRLGEAKKGFEVKQRPIKIVMKSDDDKEKVMKNLGRLKGTEKFFGKISVTDDYTTNERKQIRSLRKLAEKQSKESPGNVFKVRGNSTNGWHIVSFPRR